MDRAEAIRILNLKPDPPPTLAEIKRSYHELAQKYHPDHNPDKVAHETFILLDRAYRLLTEAEQQAEQQAPRAASSQKPAPGMSGDFRADAFRFLDEVAVAFGCSSPDLTNVTLAELQCVCSRAGIKLKTLHHSTGRPRKKTKAELYLAITDLPRFKELKRKSYDELAAMCVERQVPATIKVRGREIQKSVSELILSLL